MKNNKWCIVVINLFICVLINRDNHWFRGKELWSSWKFQCQNLLICYIVRFCGLFETLYLSKCDKVRQFMEVDDGKTDKKKTAILRELRGIYVSRSNTVWRHTDNFLFVSHRWLLLLFLCFFERYFVWVESAQFGCPNKKEKFRILLLFVNQYKFKRNLDQDFIGFVPKFSKLTFNVFKNPNLNENIWVKHNQYNL